MLKQIIPFSLVSISCNQCFLNTMTFLSLEAMNLTLNHNLWIVTNILRKFYTLQWLGHCKFDQFPSSLHLHVYLLTITYVFYDLLTDFRLHKTIYLKKIQQFDSDLSLYDLKVIWTNLHTKAHHWTKFGYSQLSFLVVSKGNSILRYTIWPWPYLYLLT